MVAPRYDLCNRMRGAIDAKIVSTETMKDRKAYIICGPPYNDKLKPFSWNDHKETETKKCEMHPDVFNFSWIYV